MSDELRRGTLDAGCTVEVIGELRLLYEASPMAFIAEQAEGSATDGMNRILDIMPTGLHQRTPLVIGSRLDVGFVADTLRHAAARASGPVVQPAL